MIRFDLSTHIYRPLTQVFAFVSTPENDFQWQYGTLASTQISHGELRLGTLFRAVSHLLGRRIETMYEVTVFDLNRKYGFKSVSGLVDTYTLYTFEIIESSTKINLSTEIDPRDVFKPNDAIIIKKFKKQFKENLAMLKSVLETQHIVGAERGI
jgi:hypothetical protein